MKLINGKLYWYCTPGQEGNCYAASEALYHILGGKKAGWVAMRLRVAGEKFCHWFLKHKPTGLIIDPSVRQYKAPSELLKGCWHWIFNEATFQGRAGDD